jgi:hypothetical protein
MKSVLVRGFDSLVKRYKGYTQGRRMKRDVAEEIGMDLCVLGW